MLSEHDDGPEVIAARVEDFLLALPLGTGRAAAEVEAAVARRLMDAEMGRAALKDRLRKWCVLRSPRCARAASVLALTLP